MSAAAIARPAVAATATPEAPGLTTPQVLKIGLVAVCIASALLMLAAISGAREHRRAIQVVGKDSAPSIVAAEHIRAALADMDAQAANELLGGPRAHDAQVQVERRRSEAISAIIAAAENITYGDAERGPIKALALEVGTYTAARQSALDRNSIAEWRAAARIMDATLLPAAEDLDRANRTALDAAYQAQANASIRSAVFLVFAALTLGGVLLMLQIFIAGRMRRMINPGLLFATLTAFLFVVYAGQRFTQCGRDLKAAKEDAFESVHRLWKARALTYAANGDQSRYLLDPERATSYEKDFGVKADLISSEFLPDELKSEFQAYLKAAKEVRTLVAGGHRADAMALAQHSSGAFERFDAALGSALEDKQKAFDEAIAQGFNEVAGFEVSAPALAFLISLFAWLGLRPRLREYAA